MEYLDKARAVLQTEINGLVSLKDDLGEPFVQLVEMCLEALRRQGKIVLSGVGKSGHVGRKVAATLASTGSPAAFMHPVEAVHGDLGILAANDILLTLSFSGETEELLALLPSVKRFDVKTVAFTGDPDSALAELSDLVVCVPVREEACPFKLAPTSSTTAMMALGDALAMVLMEANDFSQEDYGLRHPSGAIGRTVAMRVSDIMRSTEDRLPLIGPSASVQEAVVEMTRVRAGSVVVVDDAGKLLGIFTDGDFRRHAQKDLEVLGKPISTVMTANPISLRQDQMAIEVLKLVETRNINDVPVVDGEQRVTGLVDIQDLPKFKLM